MEINVGKIGGIYTLYKYKEGEEPRKIGEFKNLITDYGLNLLKTQPQPPKNISVGADGTPPTVTDTQLGSLLYQQDASETQGQYLDAPSETFYQYSVFETTFSPKGSAYTVREVGFGKDANGIFSRTQTKDLEGQPTDIAILGDEYFRVTYDARVYRPYNDVTHTLTPTGNDTTQRTVTVRAASRNNAKGFYTPTGAVSTAGQWERLFLKEGDISSVNYYPTGTTVSNQANVPSTPHPTLPQATFSTGTLSVSEAVGTIGTAYIKTNTLIFDTQIKFDPPFVKTNEEMFKLDITISWDRL